MKKKFADYQNYCTFAFPIRQKGILRYGVMVALQILALSVRVRILLSQQIYSLARSAGFFVK